MSARTYHLTGKVPPWAQWILRDAGVPETWRDGELSRNQLKALGLVQAIKHLQDQGLVRVHFESEEIGPVIEPTFPIPTRRYSSAK